MWTHIYIRNGVVHSELAVLRKFSVWRDFVQELFPTLPEEITLRMIIARPPKEYNVCSYRDASNGDSSMIAQSEYPLPLTYDVASVFREMNIFVQFLISEAY